MHRFTVDLTDEQAEILSALTAGSGLDPAALLVRAVGKGLSVMIAEVEHFGPSDAWAENTSAPVKSYPRSSGADLDDGLPF